MKELVIAGGIAVFLTGAVIGWVVFPYTISRWDRFKKSPLGLFEARLSLAVFAGFVAVVVTIDVLKDILGEKPGSNSPSITVEQPKNAKAEVGPRDTPSSTIGASSDPTKIVPATSTETTPAELVEASGVCKGLNLTVTADQIDCLDRKYNEADTTLNSVYKQVMARLDRDSARTLREEQRSWIREKEARCNEAGSEFKGGTLEIVMIKDCFVQMTEERVTYLRNYRQ